MHLEYMGIRCMWYVRYRVHCDFVSFPVSFLYRRIVSVLVRHEERGFDVTPVGIPSFAIEYFLVQFDVVVVDGIVKGDSNHLRNFFGRQVVWYSGAVFRAEAVGQNAHGWIARRCAIRIIIVICR